MWWLHLCIGFQLGPHPDKQEQTGSERSPACLLRTLASQAKEKTARAVLRHKVTGEIPVQVTQNCAKAKRAAKLLWSDPDPAGVQDFGRGHEEKHICWFVANSHDQTVEGQRCNLAAKTNSFFPANLHARVCGNPGTPQRSDPAIPLRVGPPNSAVLEPASTANDCHRT